MGIFVDEKKTFDVTVYWQTDVANGNRVKILPTKPEAKCEEITMCFRYPDYALARRVIADSSIPETGAINVLALRSTLLFTLFKSWDLKNDKGEAVKLDNAALNKVHPAVVGELVRRLYEEMVEAGLF